MNADNQTASEKASTQAEHVLTNVATAPKWALRSKTIWGAIIGALPHVLGLLGVAFDNAEVQHLAEAGSAFLGAILVVWGRATAKQPIAAGPQTRTEFVSSAMIVGAVASLALQGCGTAAYYPNGQKAVDARSNLKNFHFKGGGIAMSVDEMDNATPTKAAMNGATSFATAVGTAVATGGVR